MSFGLYPHQADVIARASEAIKTHPAIVVVMPTGAGKTRVGVEAALRAYLKGRTVMFTVHRDFLIEQTSEALRRVNVEHGIVAAGFTGDMNARVQIGSMDTLKYRLSRIKRPDLLIVDECHHSLAGGWLKVIQAFMAQGTRVVGLTATPWRLSGEGLGRVFSHMVNGPSVRWLIDNGFLCDYTAYAPSLPDLSGVHSRAGDFINSELEAAVDKPTLTGDAIAHYQRLASGKRAVAFCVSIAHSEHVAAQFNAAGIPAAHIDGNTPKDERRRTIAAFRRGTILVLASVGIFGEGFDLPAVEAAILLRPTQSLSLHLQQIGRALRTFEGKERAIILDHAGNLMRPGLGLPDREIEWSLDDIQRKKKKPGEAPIGIRQCVKCYGVFPPAPICPYCGTEQPVASRELEQVDGELQEITPEMAKAMAMQKKREVQKARTLDALEDIAKHRGYAEGWAKAVWHTRQRAAQRRTEAQYEAFARR